MASAEICGRAPDWAKAVADIASSARMGVSFMPDDSASGGGVSVRTRFAPSPTGYLHIGGVRTALFNWLFARRHGGRFILRIDDTDRQRNVNEALQPILDGFRWLGLDWDEGPEVGGPHAPYFQSQRQARHAAAVERLLAGGHAYRDYATADEIQAEREAAQHAKRRFIYSRRWMAATPAEEQAFEAQGRRAVVRLKMPREGVCAFDDQVRGPVEFEWVLEQDHVVQRPDGSCLYHLASAVDDHDFAITHVIRAVEHLSNTPRQVFIARALGYDLPAYAHLPYVSEPGSAEKLSKRKLGRYLQHPDFRKLHAHGTGILAALGATPAEEACNPLLVEFYRAVGYRPEALLNYLLLLGWSLDDRTEMFTVSEMIEQFSLDRVNRSAASFDAPKLLAFEERYMQRLTDADRVAAVVPFLQRRGLLPAVPSQDELYRVARVVAAAGERIKVAGDIVGYAEFFQADDAFPYDEKAFRKRIAADGAGARLARFRAALETVEPYDAEALDGAMHRFVEAEDMPIGRIIHAVRVAVTGKAVGFGLFEGLEILGRDACLARIDRALGELQGSEAEEA